LNTAREENLFRLTLLLRPIIVFFSLFTSYYFFNKIFEISILPFFWLFTSSLLISILFYLSAKRGKKFLLTHLFADIALIIGIMHFTGGPESVFTILFFLVITMASFFLEKEKYFLFSINLILSYNLFLFLWTRGILKVPFDLEFETFDVILRGYITTLSFIIALFLSYILSEKARRGEKEAIRSDILSKEILKNLGEIVIVKNDKGKILFKNSSFPIEVIEKNKERKEVHFDDRVFSINYRKFEVFGEKIEIFVLRDFTKEKKAEEIIKQKEKEKFLTELSQGLAHEIRNPLGSIQGAITTLVRIKDENKKKKLTELIKKEIDRLNTIVESFYKYAKIKTIKKEKLPLKTFITKIAEEYGIKNIKIASNKKHIEIDPYLMRIAVSNLIRNALEAVNNDIEKIFIEVSEKEILIKDKGPGISQEELEKIKYPFYTTKTGGLGMGLPLTERICELHGFKLEIRSKKGEGTQAIIMLK